MAFVPSKRTKDILLWMLPTKMLLADVVLYPIYLIFIQLGLLETKIALIAAFPMKMAKVDQAEQDAHSIGIRLEHLIISTTEGQWKATVGVAEHLGSDTVLYVHPDGSTETMTVRVDV